MVVSSVHAFGPSSSTIRTRPRPRPTAVSNSNQADVTPSAVSGSSVNRKPCGAVPSSVSVRRSATPAGFSTVVMFQEKAIRSRQKLVAAKSPAARATSRASRASSKAASQVRAGSSDAVMVGIVTDRSSSWVMRTVHSAALAP